MSCLFTVTSISLDTKPNFFVSVSHLEMKKFLDFTVTSSSLDTKPNFVNFCFASSNTEVSEIPQTHRSIESKLLLSSKSAIKSSEAIESHGDNVSNDPDRSIAFLCTAGDE